MEVLFIIIIFIMADSPYQAFCINIYIFVSDLLRYTQITFRNTIQSMVPGAKKKVILFPDIDRVKIFFITHPPA